MSLNWSIEKAIASDIQLTGGLSGPTIGLTPTVKVPAICSVSSTQRLQGVVLDPTQLANLEMVLRRPDDQVFLNVNFLNVEVVRSCANVFVCPCHVCRRRKCFCAQCGRSGCVCYAQTVTSGLSVRSLKGKTGYVSFRFQGQHIAEQAKLSKDISCTPGGVIDPISIPMKSHLSDPSHLVFKIPRGVLYNLSLEGMLDWSALVPSLVPIAIPNVGLKQPARFKITDKVFEALRQANVPETVLRKLNAVKDKELSRQNFQTEAESVLTADEGRQFLNLILSQAKTPLQEIVPPTGADAVPRSPVENEETSIIIPNGLILSPHAHSHWRHAVALSASDLKVSGPTQSKTIEMWETHNVVNKDFQQANQGESTDRLQTVRAIHSSPVPESIDHLLCLLPNANDRSCIVNLNANFAKGEYEPTPLICSDLRLSPVGGSIKVKGDWPYGMKGRGPVDPDFGCVVGYKQHANRGRDQYVRVERFYFGCPIPVVVIMIQERIRRLVPCKNSAGKTGLGEILVERWFSKHIPMSGLQGVPDGQTTFGRRWPFRQVRFEWPDNVELKKPIEVPELAVVPPLELPPYCKIKEKDCRGEPKEVEPVDQTRAFWLYEKYGSTPLAIDTELTDAQGRKQKCLIPLMLIRADLAVAKDAAFKEQLGQTLDAYYKYHHLREIDFREQAVGLVPVNPKGEQKALNKAFTTVHKLWLNVEFDGADWAKTRFPNVLDTEMDMPSNLPDGWKDVAYFPAVSHASIALREVDAFTSTDDRPSRPAGTFVGWNPFYNKYGFDPTNNAGEVYLDLIQPNNPNDLTEGFGQSTSSLKFAGNKGGGIATPSLDIASLSRRIGAVGGRSGATLRLAVAAAGAPAAGGYAKNSFVEGRFDPQEFIPLDAKLIGGVTLKDLLAPITAVSDLAGMPKLATDELADLQDVFRQFNEVREVVQKALTFIRDFAGIAGTLVNISKKIHGAFNENTFNDFKQSVAELSALLNLPKDVGNEISLVQTRAFFEDSLRFSYGRPELSLGIDRLYKTIRPENLTSLFDGKYLDPLLKEISEFHLENAVRPLERAETLVDMLKSPEPLLEGTFGDELQRLIADLDINEEGLGDLLQSAADELTERVVRGIRIIGSDFSARITQQITSPLDEFKKQFPKAFDVKVSPLAHFRLLILEEYLDTRVRDFLHEPTELVANQVRELMRSSVPIEELKPVLKPIADLLKNVKGTLSELHQVLTTLVNKIPKSISVKYDWDTPLKDFLIFIAKGIENGKTARFVFHTQIEKKLGITEKALTSPPTFDASVTVSDFQIKIVPSFECITIGFEKLSVRRKGNGDTDVEALVNKVELGQSMSFVKTLADLFAPKGGFYYGLSPAGITAGYAIPIPAFTVGVFAMSDLAIVIGFQLPFNGEPIRLELAVSRRDKPCLLSVGVLGGTAFFRIVLRPIAGNVSITELEAALEFGAVIVADFKLASGMLYVFGGIYYGKSDDSEVFRGYVRAGGSLDVLGLITASIEFYLGLTYEKSGGATSAYGTARVSIRVKIIFVINISVTLTYEKRFMGAGSDRLVTLLNADQSIYSDTETGSRRIDFQEWTNYSQLFA
jgi:hypothetical protein